MLPTQLSLFQSTAASTSLVGIQVLLTSECRCGCDIATLGSSKGPHHAEMFCARCSRHMGWFSGARAALLNDLINRWGRPTAPVIIPQ